MDLRADAGTLSTNSTVEGPSLKQELSLPSACCQTESGGTILLQLLEFKTHLLEAVEELHIRRDAETRFEDQISKLVLEKQELEWEKESFQHQTETVANQHKESLINVRKQFQAKMRSIEEEKGKYQVSAELKDKEINNLKEELKSLQLLKYNLEKKTSELEQKLALQIRSKDSHLNQLGEVEKRFSALSRQCAMVKQAHEKLEQNVDEAMKRNKKLTSVNEKQEATIVSLKKELEEVSNKLIKAKMSSVRHEKSYSPTGREQCIQQLQQKLNMENEMSKKLEEENVAVRAEKQEVMRSLQHTQQLLLSQTQTVSRGELQLQTQRKQYQALKQEHEVMREKTKAAEDKLAQMMESCSASKTSWDKEKAKLLHRIKSEQQELHAVDEAYNELHQKHTELSSQAEVQAQLIHEFERRDSRQSFSVSTQVFPTLVEEVRGEETISSSEPRRFGSLQLLASTQAEESDCLEDTGAVTKLVAIGAPGGQDTPNQHQLSECKRPLKPSDLQTYSLTTNSICSLSETTGCDSSMSNKHINTSKTRESDPDVGSHLTHTSSFVSDDGLLISKSTRLSDTSAAPSTSQKSVEGSLDLLSKDKSDGGVSEKEQGRKDDEKGCKNCNEEQERNEEKQRNKEVHREDAKEAGSAAETRGMAQTTDRADRQEDSQRSTEDAVDTKQPETETKDRAEAEGTDGAEERGKPGLHTPETQIPAQTTTDTTAEKSDTQQVIDIMASEPPLAAWETSDFSLSFSQRVSEKVADCIHLNEGYEISREMHRVCSVEHHSVSVGQHEEQRFCHDEAQDFQVIEKPSDRSVVNVTTELSEPLNQSSVCSSQTAAFPALSDNIVSSQEFETTTKQTQLSNPSDITSNMKPKDELCNTDLKEDCVLVGTMVEPHALPQSQEISEQERGQLSSLVTVNDKDDSSAYKKMGGQSNEDACEDDACLTVQESVEKSNLNDTCVDLTMDTEDLEFEAQTDSCQEQLKTVEVEDTGEAKTAKSRAESKPSAHPSHKNDVLPETSSGKCYEESPAKEMLLDDTNELPLPRNKSYRSSFDWGTAQRKTGSMSEKNTSGPGGFLGHPSSTIPTFLKSKHNKVPLVVTRASDLLNVSSVSGTAASSRRHQQGEWRPMGDTYRETATCYEESRASLLTSSVSRLPWQTTPGCSRAPTSAAGPSLESDRDLSWSQEREDQQSSLRAQISKIEHFLNTERLRLHKRRRIDN